MGSNKIERISSEIKKQLASIISNDLKDPRVKGLVSVVKVDCDSDLKVCKVYVSVLGADGEEKTTVKALNIAEGYIKSILKTKLDIRAIPDLRFELDDSIGYGIKISKILSGITIPKEDNE